jgi:high affinity Mn2+ porin
MRPGEAERVAVRRQCMWQSRWWRIALLPAVAIASNAHAGELTRPYSWTGGYIGGHFGYGTGTFGPATNPLLREGVVFDPSVTGLVAGFQTGYGVELPNRVYLGLEAGVTFGGATQPNQPVLPFATSIDTIASARARLGYAFGNFLPYVTAGPAWSGTRVEVNAPTGEVVGDKRAIHAGWTVGAGVEYALTGPWTARLAYDYIELGPRTYVLESIPTAVTVHPKVHLATVALNYRFDDPRARGKSRIADSGDWSIHGQTTFIPQAYPNIRSPYQGAQSLPGRGQVRETWTATAFIGRRLWEGGEVYVNPELAQGFGLNGTLGIVGFPNGEAQKAGGEFPRVRAQRYFFRQTFGFGGEQETVEDGPNQLPGKRDVDRLTVTVGRVNVGDFFDGNAYAHDPRADFMNWSVWSSAAYDYPADLPGFTRGAVVELNRKHWALRAGLFQVPDRPAGDVLTFNTGGAVIEFEERHTAFGQPGKARVGVFGNRGNTGSFREVVAQAAANPGADINALMAANRRQRDKVGVYGNIEQAVTRDVGVFARASWADGKNEILSFTDIDRSAAAGVSIKGAGWGRPRDTVGLAGAVNAIGAAHRAFHAAGGLGLLIGDGRLNYREEKILETFYAIHLSKWTSLTFDYQFIADPAYNADRGPVSIFAARFHAEF